MTWQTSYSGTSVLNSGPAYGGGHAMFNLKELLKGVGWSVLSSSDGTTYNASGDQITHYSTGAGGILNNYAWYRIRDPADRREYLAQRGTSNTSWKIIYSSSDRFTGGTPDATTLPTATDQQGLADNGTGFATIFTAGDCMTYMAAQDAAHNGVYAFWLVSSPIIVTDILNPCTILCEAMDSDFSSSDPDPCIHFVHDLVPSYVQICTATPATTSGWCGWMKYNLAGEDFDEISGAFYSCENNEFSPIYSAPDTQLDRHILLPVPYFMHPSAGTAPGFKGIGKYYRWKPNQSFTFPAMLADISGLRLVWGDLTLPGIPESFVPLF